MRTVRSEPCIRKVNRETIQRQRGQASTGSGNTGERGEGPGHALFCAPQPGSEEGHLAPGILGEGALLRVQIFGCPSLGAHCMRRPVRECQPVTADSRSSRHPSAGGLRHPSGGGLRHPSGGGLRHPAGGGLGETTSALGDRPCSPDARPHPLEDQQHPRKDRTRYAHARWRIRRTDRRLRKGLPTAQPAAAWRCKGWTETESRQGIVQ